jgi:transcriptional regulator of arginine metabolism
MKRQRQHALLQLVRQEPLSSQQEIRDRLASLGHAATQSTISRDLEELGLVRVRDPRGRLHYAPPEEARASGATTRLRAVLGEFVASVESSGNLVVVVTSPGTASAVAEVIDKAGVEGVLGTVAGDNTVLVVAREGAKGGTLAGRLRELAGV